MARPGLPFNPPNRGLWVPKALKGQIIIGRESEAWAPQSAAKINRGGGVLNSFPPFVLLFWTSRAEAGERGNWQGGRKHQIRPQREQDWRPPGAEKGWGRGAPLSRGCPCAAPTGDRVPAYSDYLRRDRAGLKAMVCCWGWPARQPGLGAMVSAEPFFPGLFCRALRR